MSETLYSSRPYVTLQALSKISAGHEHRPIHLPNSPTQGGNDRTFFSTAVKLSLCPTWLISNNAFPPALNSRKSWIWLTYTLVQHWKTIGNCWAFINKLLIRAVTNQSANRYSVLPKFVVKDLTFGGKGDRPTQTQSHQTFCLTALQNVF